MTDARDAIRAALERMNREQLALNDRPGHGLWQDITPYLDDMVDAIAAKPVDLEQAFDPKDNLEASIRYALNKWGGAMTDARDELAALIRKAGWDAQDSPDYEKCGFDSDLFIADAIIAAGWTSPRDERMEQILDAMGAWDDE